ncbi:hypothetical protein IWW36_000571 [Coemansia brasiliensis]|uniref:Uncharacterized protein n=1 Tax=Coemansia brasiliensis TaxID=2650707 RepID=A0A9W8M1K9_9FUNG|nr:hypothetical protein IWW36_000571 [Coemansia brasiliensis]
MKVPFFRSRNKTSAASDETASTRSNSSKAPKDQVVSDTEVAVRPSATATLARAPYSSPSVTNMGGNGGQLSELQAFLGQIDEFQGEAQRLFPENRALDQILGELRDECQRRVDYITRVSTPPAWMSPPQQQQQRAATNGRRSTLAAIAPARQGRAHSNYYAPSLSTDTGSESEHNARHDYLAHPPRTTAARRAVVSSSSSSSNSPSSPERGTTQPQSSTVGQRDARIGDRRRKTAPQSMFVLPGMPADSIGPISGSSHATSRQQQRSSMAISASEAPRLPRVRTSSVDASLRPQSFIDSSSAAASSNDITALAAQLNAKGSLATVRTNAAKPRQQHMPAVKAASTSYVLTIKLGGSKIEAAFSSGLQTSLISMQLAAAMGLNVSKVPSNSRVWSSGGKSWPVAGEVTALPFACGNMTFTHNFKVVQGSAAGNDMTRDMVLGNDFCVGNKGRIKDNRLHLEKLCMPISVPVRQIPAQ